MPKYDAILILGGGVREGGALPPWAQSRYELALELAGDEPLVCLSAGTTHRPPPQDSQGFPIFEASAGARYLLSRGVSEERVHVEASSWDTIGNAYFARVIHVEPAGWRKLLIITSEFHMPRSKAIFDWVFELAQPLGAELHYRESADLGFTPKVLEARREKELCALETFERDVRPNVSSLKDLHDWLFTKHGAYAAKQKARSDESGDSEVLSSY